MIKKITFIDKLGITIAANLYIPNTVAENKKYPAIVLVGPAGSVKEQVIANYAELLVDRGYICLTLDSPFQGESNGTPRGQERPYTKIENIRSAIDYLVTIPYIDESRIGGLGVCAGGGYMANAAMTERRLKAVALASPVDGGREMREIGATELISQLEDIAKTRTEEARSGRAIMFPWMPEEYKNSDDVDSAMGYDYYTDNSRGKVQNWSPEMRFTSMDSVASFDAFHMIESLLTQPISITVGSIEGSFGALKDAKYISEQASSKNKELHIIAGAAHFDFYDDKDIVKTSVEYFVNLFRKYL